MEPVRGPPTSRSSSAASAGRFVAATRSSGDGSNDGCVFRPRCSADYPALTAGRGTICPASRFGAQPHQEVAVNAARNYAEKGLVQDLRSTAEKIAIVTDRAMAQDSVTEETVMLFDRLVARAASTLSTIHKFRAE